MMPERVAEIVANSTIMIFQQTRIHSEASVIITSCSDKRSKKICSRERRTSYKCMRVRLSHKDVGKILRAQGSLRSAILATSYCTNGSVDLAVACTKSAASCFSLPLLRKRCHRKFSRAAFRAHVHEGKSEKTKIARP